jgi:hypothetical protein
MEKPAGNTWEAFLEKLSVPSPDYMAGIEDLPVQERKFEEAGSEHSVIGAAERRKRQQAFDFARASIGLEGFKLSDEMEAHGRRFINGEIDLEEFLKRPIGQKAQR